MVTWFRHAFRTWAILAEMVVSQRSGRSHKPLKLCGRKVSQDYIIIYYNILYYILLYIIIFNYDILYYIILYYIILYYIILYYIILYYIYIYVTI